MIRTRSLLIALILIIASISISYADITVTPPAGSVSLPSINSDSPGTAIASIISWMIGLTAILTVLAITWSGIQMIFAT